MQESQSQSDFKLPFIEYHSQHRLPIRMNPSFRLKHTNPVRVQYMKYMERRSVDEIKNETYYLEKFAKINKYPYQESNKQYQISNKIISESRNRDILAKQQKEKKPSIKYQKPPLKYFNLDDSDNNLHQMEYIFHNLKPNKVFISQ
ncbi:unnamed protein product (macronuclear) [Paramecium tetraurelia]|uniref:Uncharacterized protein n=1 Tax=Paramecium tetraurelia TaxID=5888 RepID=A0D9N0_PARTE|nr:uncharacterized protein GSPATT00014677001 [Paramecium tetraurelia]CAK79747.1 unnamed protein product [Paramecium tetraurelia]|eukprot:XP_001447144.1 hypothetical protein (macronuclear) [Paramecium tetraurelia strain d4-2]